LSNVICDTDFLSAFLKVSELNIVYAVVDGRMIIPQTVIDELKNDKGGRFSNDIISLMNNEKVEIQEIEYGTKEFELYIKFTDNPDSEFTNVDKGEAAALAIAIIQGGTIASNNLRDIMQYVKGYKLNLMTTGMAIHEAVENGIIGKDDASRIWDDIVRLGCKIGADSFEEYVNKKAYIIE